MAVYNGLDGQVMETQEVLCPRGYKAKSRSKSRQRREKRV